MLFGMTSFSELPLSTLRPQSMGLLNGEIYGIDFIIDQIFPSSVNIDIELTLTLDKTATWSL